MDTDTDTDTDADFDIDQIFKSSNQKSEIRNQKPF